MIDSLQRLWQSDRVVQLCDHTLHLGSKDQAAHGLLNSCRPRDCVGAVPLGIVPVLANNRDGDSFHRRSLNYRCCMSLDSGTPKSRPGTDSLRNRKRRGSRWIETTRWGAIVKYQREVTPAMRVANGNRLSSLSLRDSAGGSALTLYAHGGESFVFSSLICSLNSRSGVSAQSQPEGLWWTPVELDGLINRRFQDAVRLRTVNSQHL